MRERGPSTPRMCGRAPHAVSPEAPDSTSAPPASLPRRVPLHLLIDDSQQLLIRPRLPPMRLERPSICYITGVIRPLPRLLCALEERPHPIHAQVEEVVVHVAHGDVQLADELGPDRRPVPLEIVAQIVAVLAHRLRDRVIDVPRALVPERLGVAVRADRRPRRLPA